MSRRNRRRVRNGNRGSRNAFQHDTMELSIQSSVDSPTTKTIAPPLQVHKRRGDLTTKHWHNRYIAWQKRDKKQKEERTALLEARTRIFGGESDEGDDEEGLCGKMLEYFSGLDYIDE